MDVYSLAIEEKFAKPLIDNGVSKVVQFSFPKGKYWRNTRLRAIFSQFHSVMKP